MANKNFWRPPANQKIKFHRYWWGAALTLLVVAAQCGAPMPPLPETLQAQTITVAVLSPTEGELAPFGQMFRNGIVMAFDAQNQRNDTNGHRLEWQLYNTNCTFQNGKQAAQQAIDDGAQFIIGPICSEAAIAAAIVAEANGAVLISPAATNPLVTVNNQGDTRPTVFRVAYTPDLQGQAAAQFSTDKLGANTAAIITESGDSYAVELVDAFISQFTAAGGQIVYQNTFTPGITNSADLLAEVIQSEAELVYLPVSALKANQMGGELRRISNLSMLPLPALLGSDTWTLGELDPVALTGGYYPVHFTSLNEQPVVQEWTAAYKSKFAVEPDTLAALGFDAANILVGAIMQSSNVEPLAVGSVIAGGEFDGVTGPTIFNAQNNPVKPIPFFSIEQGKIADYIVSTP